MTEIKQLMRQSVFTGEIVDPGGRVLHFGGRSVRVSDECNSCDARAIRRFIQEAQVTAG